MVRHVVEDEVEAVPVSGEVSTEVYDDVVSADRADHLYVPRAAHAGHFGAKRFGDLHRECTVATRGSIDQDLLTWLDLALVAKQLESGRCRHADGRGLLEGEVCRLRNELVHRSGRVLGEGARAPTEYLIAGPKAGHAIADCLDRSRYVRSRHTAFWLPVRRPSDVRHACHNEPVTHMYGSRVNANQRLTILDRGLGDFLKTENSLGVAVPVLNDCFHRYTSGLKPLKMSQNGIT